VPAWRAHALRAGEAARVGGVSLCDAEGEAAGATVRTTADIAVAQRICGGGANRGRRAL